MRPNLCCGRRGRRNWERVNRAWSFPTTSPEESGLGHNRYGGLSEAGVTGVDSLP